MDLPPRELLRGAEGRGNRPLGGGCAAASPWPARGAEPLSDLVRSGETAPDSSEFCLRGTRQGYGRAIEFWAAGTHQNPADPREQPRRHLCHGPRRPALCPRGPCLGTGATAARARQRLRATCKRMKAARSLRPGLPRAARREAPSSARRRLERGQAGAPAGAAARGGTERARRALTEPGGVAGSSPLEGVGRDPEARPQRKAFPASFRLETSAFG